MHLQTAVTRVSFFFVSLLVPLSVFGATSPEQALTMKDSAAVSRGDFIRASVQVLGLTLQRNVTLQYRRPVPVSLQPYVKTAKSFGGIDQFGNDLKLSTAITRGEALQLLMKLTKQSPSDKTIADFVDVSYGTDLAKAVRLAIEKQWMNPVTTSSFGVGKSLSGADARALLKAVVGDTVDDTTSTRVPQITIQLKGNNANRLPKEDMLRTVWRLLNDQYLYKDKIDQQEAAYKAAEAIVQTLKDPYTEFIRPVGAKQFSDQLSGQITGIGAQVDYRDSTVIIVAPIPGSPAAKAGLKSGDEVLAVDGESIVNVGLAPAVEKIRGPKGSVAKLHIRRDGNEMDINVTRDVINIPEIDVSYQGSVAIVKIAQFGQTTDDKLRGVLTEVSAHKPTGLIIDLRNNPGGLLHAAVTMLSNFLPDGSTAVHIVTSDSSTPQTTEEPPTIDASVKMVVLVNKGSASAAEIAAGALQDTKRATIVGETSFGKGTVQQLLEFTDGSELKMTVAEWQTPLHHAINHIGVKPDIVVPTVDGGRDDQMLKALELLR